MKKIYLDNLFPKPFNNVITVREVFYPDHIKLMYMNELENSGYIVETRVLKKLFL